MPWLIRVVVPRCRVVMAGLAAGLAITAFPSLPAQAEAAGRDDIPADARPSDLSLYLKASVDGGLVHVCQSTDVVGRFAWYLRASEARLFDAQTIQLVTSRFRYSGIPLVRVEATWQDVGGGTIVARAAERGPLPGKPELQWERYDVETRSGAGRLIEARAIIRIAQWRTIPYSEPCDGSRAGVEIRSSFAATDLFFK